jgi:hypothetical protein
MLTVVMLSVVMLSVFILSVVMLSAIMLSVVMLSVIMLSVIMLSVVMLSFVMLIVVIGVLWRQHNYLKIFNQGKIFIIYKARLELVLDLFVDLPFCQTPKKLFSKRGKKPS